MSINEVSKTPESGPVAAPEKVLSNDIFDEMIKSFKEKQGSTTDQASTTTTTDKTAEAVGESAKEVDLGGEISKTKISFAGGEHCRLLAAVDTADQNLADNPLIHKHINKLEMQAKQLDKNAWEQEQNMRDTAQNTFSKTDMRKLSELGPNPLGDPWAKKAVPFEFNNAQRAWLKENHPDVYKQLEKHDRTSLERSNVSETLRQLGETRDGPVNARVDLARFQHRSGMNADAVSTLTEAINRNPSIVTRPSTKGDPFRAVAVETGAAWDPAFRNAVEHSGGNILDFVSRPMAEFHKDIKIVPKPQVNFNPEKLK
jgi:hypothetical protein